MLPDLGIDANELHTRHWAIKDADLAQVLLKHKRITTSQSDHRAFRVRVIEGSRPAAAAKQSVSPRVEAQAQPIPGKAIKLSEVIAATRPVNTLSRPRIFIVHGHDDELLAQVARFIEKMGMEAVILHEQPNSGHTIISKFKQHAGHVDYAVVLMTPDDVGRAKAEKKNRPRARQNVIFELGFFFTQLDTGRVAAFVKGNVETPSDFDGVLYISADAADWKVKLIREFQAAGIEGDYVKGI
jgi:predicted nucleotide-binding protein